MTHYIVKRTNKNGDLYKKEYSTYRKAYNAFGKLQEKSSRSSTLQIIERSDRHEIVMDTITGIL